MVFLKLQLLKSQYRPFVAYCNNVAPTSGEKSLPFIAPVSVFFIVLEVAE